MKQGRTLVELGNELQRQRNARKDFIADTRTIEMKSNDQGTLMRLLIDDTPHVFTISDIAHQQVASRLQIPYRYYQKMQSDYPRLLDENVNSWFAKNGERRMVRVLDNQVRAFLSDRYRRLDNLELCAAVLPVIHEMRSVEIVSCDVTDRHLYLKVINKKLKAEISLGDVVQAGFVISNSEVGLGSLKVEPLIYRLICKNGLIMKDFSQKRYHVGKQVAGDNDAAYEIYSDATLEQDDKAFFMKVQDTVRCAVDETNFQMGVDRMRQAMNVPIHANPVKAVEELADRFQITQNERGDVLRQLFMGNDNSRYGLINAVTAASKLACSYERATDLERIGGALLASSLPTCLLKNKRTEPYNENITPIHKELAHA